MLYNGLGMVEGKFFELEVCWEVIGVWVMGVLV